MAEPKNRLATTPNSPAASADGNRQSAEVAAYHALAGAAAIDLSDAAQHASTPFVGQWRTLVSTTNWEKGRIICTWRESLEQAGASAAEHSDDAWAQLVGGVSGQHVGRLRRVWRRFGETAAEYQGLYWSHFQAACEWPDAEMWLEGAVQNRWSVSQMRGKRWEVVGPGGDDATRRNDDDPHHHAELPDQQPGDAWAEGSLVSEPRSADGQPPADHAADAALEPASPPPAAPRELDAPAEPLARPFAELPDLPEDVAEAFEQMKLAILRHKLAGWAQIPRNDLLGVLASLVQLAEAPSGAAD